MLVMLHAQDYVVAVHFLRDLHQCVPGMTVMLLGAFGECVHETGCNDKLWNRRPSNSLNTWVLIFEAKFAALS